MSDFATVADEARITKTVAALEQHNFTVAVVDNATAAKNAVLALLPQGAEVLTVTSKTLDTIGLVGDINESGVYDALRPKLNAMMGDPAKKREQRKLAAAPDYVVGSVHALTEDGMALIASATGSQLPPYTYGAGQVIWVVGAQKIVADLQEAEQRLTDYVFPLEDARSQQAYGMGSGINKLLFYKKESTPGRVHIVIVKEALGF